MTLRLGLNYVAKGALIVSLFVAVPALAQQKNGVTSGPAVGTAVVPSTTAQKQDAGSSTGSAHSNDTSVQPGAVGVGAPGVAAKSGSESGSSPGPGSNKRP